jgi:serine/threonine-protein kinase
MAVQRTNLQDRYELREVLGRGGMGVVYKAYDRVMGREVALKTILDIDDPATLQLFYQEWSILAIMVHPNVINIYDIGEFDQDGVKKPFFVMPLLPGVTLEKLIKDGSPRLSVPGVLEIVTQAAHGLHAAHEQGLVHHDVKPSNIFVMDDNSVKIIDFGIAREAGSGSAPAATKGTLYYLSPEQLQGKAPSPLSDLFALGVVTYQALAHKRPFDGTSEAEVVDAILHKTPPPVSDVNREVSIAIGQVIHKALAKQPQYRFANMREFAGALEKAARNEPLECFDASKVKPRIERALKSFEAGDYAFANEVLAELEGEGHMDPEIGLLRRQVEQAAKQTRVRQILDGARRFVEAGEFPLALRKIQEALEIDPYDADALALKAKVERERRERRVADLIQSARKHVDERAYRQAREALDNVVQLKPNETEALGLLAEVGRRESEMSQARDEKARLYQSAVEAWEKGEVTSALNKLEELVKMDEANPEPDAGRSTTYRNFYDQVHSENDALRNAYQAARRDLAEGNCEGALTICKQYLAKYPNHALFQALKFDTEARQRQQLSQIVAEIDRKVEAEPNLENRAAMLEDALKKYPGETHFERALQSVRDKRALVASIVSKASFFENRGQLDDALDQLQILKSIHENQPGLPEEIQRLTERRDRQAHMNSKAKWVDQARNCMAGGDYQRAQQAVITGLGEFPGEAELLALQEEVRAAQVRGVQALELLGKAREASDQGNPQEGLATLREAYRLDPRNSVIRTVTINSLLEEARRVMDSDLQTAESIVKEVQGLDPNHLQAQILAGRIAERKNEEAIAACLAQALHLQSQGDVNGAQALVAQALAANPHDPRLLQMQHTLEQSPSASTPLTAPPAQPDQTVDIGMSLTQALEGLPPSVAAPAPTAVSPEREIAAQSRKLIIGTGIAAGLLVLIALGVTVVRHRQKTAVLPVSAKYSIVMRSTPAGAEIKINGDSCGITTCALDLPAGNYRASAQLTGYQSTEIPFTVGPGSSKDVNLNLTPVGPRVTIFTDLTSGAVSLDDAPVGQIQDGGAEIANLAAGKHVLAVKGGDSAASISVEIAPGSAPALSAPIDAKNVRCFLVAGFGPDAKVYSNATGYRVTLDGKLIGPLTADGMPLGGLTPGTHELALDSDSGQHDRVAFESQPSATLYVSLGASQTLGMLTVETNEDQAHVLINGARYRRDTVRGHLVVYLAPSKYTITVQKDGFAPAPDQPVEIKRGVETKVSFTLTPAKAILAVHHAPPGTDVQVDNISRGTTHPDGEFQVGGIEPGRHTVTLHHDGFKPLQSDETFGSGKTVDVQGAMDAAPVTGTLRFNISPPDAHVRIRREGDAQDRDVTGASVTVPEGRYTVSVSAPQYTAGSATVQVAAGGTAVAEVTLKHAEAPKPAPKIAPAGPVFGLEDWLKTPGWAQQDGMLTHTSKGGEWVMATPDISQGTIRFTVVSLKGKHVAWVVACRDQKNYVYYEVDDKNVTRYEVKDGNKQIQIKVAHGLDRKKPMGIGLGVTPRSVVISVNRDGWLDLDKWDVMGTTVHGRFGFRITGSDEIGLQDFSITPN